MTAFATGLCYGHGTEWFCPVGSCCAHRDSRCYQIMRKFRRPFVLQASPIRRQYCSRLDGMGRGGGLSQVGEIERGGGCPIQMTRLHKTGKRRKEKKSACKRPILREEGGNTGRVSEQKQAPRREIIGSILHGMAIVNIRQRNKK
jgi:hypothetical protein